MPYEMVKVKGGYKVQKKDGVLTSTGRRYFSNKPLTKDRAAAQMRALYASKRQQSPTRKQKPSKRKQKPTSPKRKQKPTSPKRKQKPTSPKRKQKKPTSPRIRKRTSSPKRYL